MQLLDGENRAWLVHPKYKNHVDVIAIEMKIPDGCPTLCANDVVMAPLLQRVGMRVFIIGFPFGRESSGLPVWKQGTFATEPSFSPDLMRYMLVDTASRPGMSGSPVIQREHGTILLEDGKQGRIMNGDGAGRMVGVYSGRRFTKNLADIQLGLVWPIRLVEEIINSNTRDDGCWHMADSEADVRSNKPY